jgi:hypothetical protein
MHMTSLTQPSTLGNVLKEMLNPDRKRVEIVRKPYTREVQVPGTLLGYIADFAGTMNMPREQMMSLLWAKMEADVANAMDAVIASRTAARECFELEERVTQAQERSHAAHDVARLLVDNLCGDTIALVL